MFLVIPLKMMVKPKLLFSYQANFAPDAQMGEPIPLLGASTTTQGILRGKAGGNFFNMADAEKPVDTGLGALFGKILIYKSGDDPSSIKPQMVLKTEVDKHMAPVLTEVGELYTPPKSRPSVVCFLSNSYNISGKNQRVFVYEDGNWCLKGRYNKAVKINDTLAWSNDKGQYSLALSFVELFVSFILNLFK